MQKQMNYKGIFVAGCVLMFAGIVFLLTLPVIGVINFGSGIGLMAIGLAKRNDWYKDEQ